MSFAVSLALASLVAGNLALAQENPAVVPAQANSEVPASATVLVVGTRVSQQSGIERKKNAATAMDSIVAEDVGSLPDRNVGEAISRMAGIVLDRGDFGEGVSVSVRGNGPDLTRVELDGQGVQSAGGTDQLGGGSGRGVELRQLSADLIKSVDVVKGSTADMTEGSLGGGIIIKTRTGLDFKKPFASLRLGSTQLSLNNKWTPDANLILANKFLDGRLGLMMNVSTSTLANESHSMQVSQTAQQGYYRLADFDNSPEKTYAYLPGTVNTSDIFSTTPYLRSPMAAGATFNSATPLELITKSAAAQSKQACYDAFPTLTVAQLAAIPGSGDKGPALSQRGNELLTCLNQWYDYTPSNVRYFIKKELDKKQNLDLRADFKVNNSLTVYAKGSFNRRDNTIEQLTYGLGNITVNPNSTFSPTYVGPAYTNNTANTQRSVVPGSGYYLYNSPSGISNNYPIAGTAINIDPASVTVDASHHLTKYTISDGIAVPDQILEKASTTGQYVQAGGTWKSGGLSAEFFVGAAKSNFQRAQRRVSYSQYYGPATLELAPTGLWGYTIPATSTFDEANPLAYGRLFTPTAALSAQALSATNTLARPAYTIAQQPLVTLAVGPNWQPQIRETGEQTARLDLTYATPESIPFFKRFKGGFNLRSMQSNAWESGAGRTLKSAVGTFGQPGYIPGVYLPSAQIRSNFIGCQDTPGSLAPGGAACNYGTNPSPTPLLALDVQNVVTPQQYQNIIAQTLTSQATDTSFFNGAKGRPANLLDNWTGIDVAKVAALTNFPNVNYDCVKECTASDGKVYAQPVTKLTERIDSFYLMTDFNVGHIPFTDRALPFGLELEGNLGYRYVRTKVHGTGSMTFTSIVKKTDGSFDVTNPGNPAGITTNTLVQNTAVDASTTDFLPSYNLAMWVVPDKVVVRYSHAKTVARPPVARLLPAGACTYDERLTDNNQDASQRCTTVGNPALQARMNVNQNLSVEYYPNRDTMFSLAALKQDGRIGEFITQGVSRGSVFGGSELVDPQTNIKLSDLPFDYSTYVNGPASTRRGLEFATKSAFTFLPWLFRYTGFDGNYTKMRSTLATATIVDLLTGTELPPARESATQYNVALWYDDGRVSARLAVQGAASWFTCIAGCGQAGNRNYPAQGVVTGALPYTPGSPNFKDATRFIDGKIGYKWKPGVEFFIEGRNLGNVTTTNSQGPYAPLSNGVPNLLDYAYSGRRIMLGVQMRTM